MRRCVSNSLLCKLVVGVCLLTSFTVLAQPNTSIRFYGHPGFDFYTSKDQSSSSPYFRGGPLVLFVTSQLSEKVSVAGELNLHYMAATGAETELERMYIKYDWKPALHVSLGRMYSPIGFWNVNYNFGLVLQPNISRPRILNPTHDGGFIQTREIGLQLGGDGIGKPGFFYRLLIGNGIGRNGGLLGVPYQLGTNMAYTLQLGIEPVEGLKISVSGVTNRLATDSQTQFDDLVPESMNAQMFAASISHMSIDKKFEFIAEGYSNKHDYKTLNDETLKGAILYLGYRTNEKLTPYLFGEWLDFPVNDAYYPTVNPYSNQAYGSSLEINLGLRYRASSHIVLKGELAAYDQDVFGMSYGFKTQAAFSF